MIVRRLHRALSPRRAFSIVEWLVVVAVVVVLAGIFVPYFAKIREADRRVRCGDNLRAIMDGLRQYAMLRDAKGKALYSYPSVAYDPSRPGYVAYTGADSPNPFARGTTVKPNDVTASLWLLVRGGLAAPGRFVCPSARQSVDPLVSAGKSVPVEQRSNFTSGESLSYSYASPFSSAPGYKMNLDSHVGDFAIMADKSPGLNGKSGGITTPRYNSGPFSIATANSRNHARVGQNVLYADGHVAWQTTPYCGVGQAGARDNIFTALSPIPLSPEQRPPVQTNGYWGHDIGPSWTNDSYLVPTDGE